MIACISLKISKRVAKFPFIKSIHVFFKKHILKLIEFLMSCNKNHIKIMLIIISNFISFVHLDIFLISWYIIFCIYYITFEYSLIAKKILFPCENFCNLTLNNFYVFFPSLFLFVFCQSLLLCNFQNIVSYKYYRLYMIKK